MTESKSESGSERCKSHEIEFATSPVDLCRSLRTAGCRAIWFSGDRSVRYGPWQTHGFVALDPTVVWQGRTDSPVGRRAALDQLDLHYQRRKSMRRAGSCSPGPGQDSFRGTGLAVLLDYRALGLPSESQGLPQYQGRVDATLPSVSVAAVDRAVVWGSDSVRPRLTWRGQSLDPRWVEIIRRSSRPRSVVEPCAAVAVSDSLPKQDWMRTVMQVQDEIRQGEIYQANLCRRISITGMSEPIDYMDRLVRTCPAPHAAGWFDHGWAVVSISPERFVEIDAANRIRTEPIKGTRPRSDDPKLDAMLARELVGSAKDQAELLMIFDLERNDFGRICLPGSIRVPELSALRSFPAVHHLVAQVEGQLAADWKPSEILRAVYPGGSITGAPKRRAMEILSILEPMDRGYFTGSLLWFGDDGRVDSSLLIRTAIFDRMGAVHIGAGCGIVADSDPEAEWLESNHKARPLTQALGVEPEEAGSWTE